jgi:hexosaminidase
VPLGRIEDAPRFAWRGVLLDVARHFLPVADVLRFIDLIAFHKLNVLHLHLTDDQGWRIEVPGWPRISGRPDDHLVDGRRAI